MTDPVAEPAVDDYSRLNAIPRLPRFAPATLRAAWWTLRALRRTRRRLRRDGLAAQVSPLPPRLPWGARTGVNAVLARTEPTCLERALVLQAWLLEHGVRRDVVVGVASADDGVKAHAWLDGVARPDEYEQYRVIHRIAPRRPRTA